MAQDYSVLNIRIPKQLKADFQKYCEDQDMTVSQALRRFMAGKVKNHHSKRGK